jgi:hypothetical protein
MAYEKLSGVPPEWMVRGNFVFENEVPKYDQRTMDKVGAADSSWRV